MIWEKGFLLLSLPAAVSLCFIMLAFAQNNQPSIVITDIGYNYKDQKITVNFPNINNPFGLSYSIVTLDKNSTGSWGGLLNSPKAPVSIDTQFDEHNAPQGKYALHVQICDPPSSSSSAPTNCGIDNVLEIKYPPNIFNVTFTGYLPTYNSAKETITVTTSNPDKVKFGLGYNIVSPTNDSWGGLLNTPSSSVEIPLEYKEHNGAAGKYRFEAFLCGQESLNSGSAENCYQEKITYVDYYIIKAPTDLHVIATCNKGPGCTSLDWTNSQGATTFAVAVYTGEIPIDQFKTIETLSDFFPIENAYKKNQFNVPAEKVHMVGIKLKDNQGNVSDWSNIYTYCPSGYQGTCPSTSQQPGYSNPSGSSSNPQYGYGQYPSDDATGGTTPAPDENLQPPPYYEVVLETDPAYVYDEKTSGMAIAVGEEIILTPVIIEEQTRDDVSVVKYRWSISSATSPLTDPAEIINCTVEGKNMTEHYNQTYMYLDLKGEIQGDMECITKKAGRIEISLTYDTKNDYGGGTTLTTNMIALNIGGYKPPTYSNTYEKLAPSAGYEDEVLVDYSAYNNPFPDTDFTKLKGQAAAELYRRGVIGGFPDGQFKGDREVNRAEAAKFLLLSRYETVQDVKNNGKFPDVLDRQWYTKFVLTAANKGIISGHPDGTFRPADRVNTAEFLKMLTLTFGLSENLPYDYQDVDSKAWYEKYAGTARKYNLFPDRTINLEPGRYLTRYEVAVAMYHYLKNR